MRLVEALAEGLPVLYNSVVTDVAYSTAGVCVRTASHQVTGALQLYKASSQHMLWHQP